MSLKKGILSVNAEELLKTVGKRLREQDRKKRAYARAFLDVIQEVEKKRKVSEEDIKKLSTVKHEVQNLKETEKEIKKQISAETSEETKLHNMRDEETNIGDKEMEEEVETKIENILKQHENTIALLKQTLQEKEAVALQLEEKIRLLEPQKIEVPALPKWVYDIFTKTFKPEEIDDILLDMFVYEDFLVLWKHRNETKQLKAFQENFELNPYNIDKTYFDNVAWEKAQLIGDLVTNPEFAKMIAQVEKPLNNAQIAFLDMYDSLRMQITAYKAVLDALVESASNSYWEMKKPKIYDRRIIPIERNIWNEELILKLHQKLAAEDTNQRMTKNERNFANKINATTWEDTFYSQQGSQK